MEKGSRGGWQHRVGGDIATVIISWLIDPVELDGAALFVFRDIGHETGRHLGWDDWEEVCLGFWTTWRECNHHVMFVEDFGAVFSYLLDLEWKFMKIWQSSTCPHIQEALYHIAKLEFGQLAVNLQRLHSCLNRWLLKLDFWANCPFKESVIKLFDAVDPQNMMISFLKYKGSYIFSCRNTNLYCEK